MTLSRPAPALRLRLARFGLGIALAAGAAMASFPSKPVRIVVPFAPGGGTDLIARTLGLEMSKELGQPVIIDNKPGAGTIIGTDAVAKAQPDGYTLVMPASRMPSIRACRASFRSTTPRRSPRSCWWGAAPMCWWCARTVR